MKHQLLGLAIMSILFFSCKKTPVTTQTDKGRTLHSVASLTAAGGGQIHNATMDYVYGQMVSHGSFGSLTQTQRYDFLIDACVDYLSSDQDINTPSSEIYGLLENANIDANSMVTVMSINVSNNANEAANLFQGDMHNAVEDVFAAINNSNNINDLETATNTILSNNETLLSSGDYESLQYAVEIAKASWNHWIENDKITDWHDVAYPTGPTLQPGKAKNVVLRDAIGALIGTGWGPLGTVIVGCIWSAAAAS